MHHLLWHSAHSSVSFSQHISTASRNSINRFVLLMETQRGYSETKTITNTDTGFGLRTLRVNCNGTRKDKRAQFLSDICNVSHDTTLNFSPLSPPPMHPGNKNFSNNNTYVHCQRTRLKLNRWLGEKTIFVAVLRYSGQSAVRVMMTDIEEHCEMMRNMVFTVRRCQHLAQPPSWMTTPCRLPVTA
jgi:hypothetical protein